MEPRKFVDIQIIEQDIDWRGVIYIPEDFLNKKCKITLEIIEETDASSSSSGN
jgi:hypothetical protein